MNFGEPLVNSLISAATWGSVSALIWKLADTLDRLHPQNSNPPSETRERALRLIRPVYIGRVGAAWAHSFRDAFNAVFTSRHWDRRCLKASAISSIVTIVLATLFLAAFRPADIWRGLSESTWVDQIIEACSILQAIACNFFALWVTRKCINLMIRLPAPKFQGAIVAVLFATHAGISFVLQFVDLIATNRVLIAIWCFTGDTPSFYPNYISLGKAAEISWRVLTLDRLTWHWLLSVPVAWSTFLTASWLVLYVAASSLIRLGDRWRKFLKRIAFLVPTQSPFHVIAFALWLAWSVSYAVLIPITSSVVNLAFERTGESSEHGHVARPKEACTWPRMLKILQGG